MKVIFIFLICMLSFSNCAVGPVSGLLFTSNSFPGSFNPANDVKAVKSAEGCHHNILLLITFGDAGAGTIALENKISRIATIDHSTANFLIFLYRNYCTIVTGEPK